jgi:hypothetical protein
VIELHRLTSLKEIDSWDQYLAYIGEEIRKVDPDLLLIEEVVFHDPIFFTHQVSKRVLSPT